ncbi:MAG: S9 family peptidase [Acidobacteriota bacterium]
MQDRTAALIETFAALSAPAEFSLSPDGQSVAYTAHVGHPAQIFSLPVERAAWPCRLTATLDDCAEPQWSPDGARIVFVRGHALWVMHADGTEARELIAHPAGSSSPRWSPDASRIAFISRRRGWDHLWTIAPDGSGLAPVTRGPCDAVDPVWSPDARWIAYGSPSEADLTRGVHLVPAEGGDPELISPPGAWSGAPSFAPDGKSVAYLSDRDGWFHVYLYDRATRATRQLTRGECEDGGPHFYQIDPQGGPIFSPDGQQVAFIRHREGKFDLWVAQVATGEARRISKEDGEYRIVGWLPDSQRLAVTFENPATVGDLWLLSTDGPARQMTDSSVAPLWSPALVLPEWVAYPARDGLAIHAALFRPASSSGKAPAVVFLHGGPNFEFGHFYYPLPQILAQEGYVVLAPNYRGSTGYGTAFREANFREWGHADAHDVIDGARWLQAQDYVDPARVAVVGPSYGGYLTLCALTLAPDLFCAGVDLYGDSDLVEAYRSEDRDARLDLQRQMGTPEENPAGYRRGSPVYGAENIRAPLLILHGRQDLMVVPRMSERMIEALKIENKYVEAHWYEGEAHGFAEPANKKDAWERIVRFLNRFCAPLSKSGAM